MNSDETVRKPSKTGADPPEHDPVSAKVSTATSSKKLVSSLASTSGSKYSMSEKRHHAFFEDADMEQKRSHDKTGGLGGRGQSWTQADKVKDNVGYGENAGVEATKFQFGLGTPSASQMEQFWETPTSRLGSAEDDRLDAHGKYLSKAVHGAWYQRYVDVVDGDQVPSSQAQRELIRDEIEKAMRKSYGEGYRNVYSRELSLGTARMRMEHNAMRAVRECFRVSFQSVTYQKGTWEYMIMEEITNYLKKLRRGVLKQGKKVSSPRSKWNVVKAFYDQGYFKQEAARIKKEKLRKTFRRGTNTVLIAIRFQHVLTEKHLSMLMLLSELPDVAVDRRSVTKGTALARKGTFDPTNYQREIKNSPCVSLSSILTLTKHWTSRSRKEVTSVVKNLYPVLIHNQYPIKVMFQFAAVGWYTRLYKNRPVIRCGGSPICSIVVLSGQILVMEPVKNRFDSQGHQTMRFVKFVEKGEQLGDEKMDTFNRIRTYSAFTTTTAEILYIDQDEYQEHLAAYDPRVQTGPQHILYICRLFPFNAIPRQDVINAAKKEILVCYFGKDAVVAASLEKSEFIFFVVHGTCHTAVEKKVKAPAPARSLKWNTRQTSGIGSYGWSLSPPPGSLSRTSRLSEAAGSISDVDTIEDCSFVNSGMARSFARRIQAISKESQTLSREEIMRKIENLRLVKSMGKVYGEDCVRHVTTELADRIIMYETLNRDCEEELEQVKAKTIQVKRSLSRVAQQSNSISLLNARIKDSGMLSEMNLNDSKTPTAAASREAYWSRQSSMKQSVDPNSTHFKVTFGNGQNDPISESRANSNKGPSNYSNLTGEPRPDGAVDGGGSTRKSDVIGITSPRGRHGGDIVGHFGDDLEATDEVAPLPSRRQTQTSQSGSPHDRSSLSAWLEAFDVSRGSSDTDRPDDRPSSPVIEYSKPIASYAKGDLIGHEYIDYNDGKYRPPESDVVVISDGVEVVMVTKRFLLKHLYNDQTKYNPMTDKRRNPLN